MDGINCPAPASPLLPYRDQDFTTDSLKGHRLTVSCALIPNMIESILFSPSARVWNYRFLLLATVAVVVGLGIQRFWADWTGSLMVLMLLGTLCLILTHHLTFLFPYDAPGLALIDLISMAVELSGKYPVARFYGHRQVHDHSGAGFLGHIDNIPGRYVREKSIIIIIARALILSCIVLGVPAFGIYAIIIVPLGSEVYTRSLAQFGNIGCPLGNVTVSLICAI
ncbi:hypothetical protein B0H17DRAFT_1144373 [Mycena rosella]|uniref:Uncharacterized protein n=1 Tax=Mycena rosella TaxID=1033263 RepID=A0AAD7CU23_MYCRO|nr:hypothetical protein B0H17DRAFT_1144373 [Mycena rosella]